MLVTVDQLEVGDEFIVPCMSDLRYYRLVRPVQPKKGNPTSYRGQTLYKAAKCSCRLDDVKYANWTSKQYVCSPDQHNTEKFVDLNYKNIWLIKKA